MKYMLRILIGVLSLTVFSSAQDYADLLNKTLGFYDYQRAGVRSGSSGSPYYGSSNPHSQDNYNGTALDAGWYDAGDFVKFGLPMGYATYCLLKGYDLFPKSYTNFFDRIKPATDYLTKAVISESQVILDVGDGDQDHQSMTESGESNSGRTSPRNGRLTDGADVSSYYAASLALMSMLYRSKDAAYADKCLDKAKQAFKFASNNKRVSRSYGTFYVCPNAKWVDKYLCAAIELYRATKDIQYKKAIDEVKGQFSMYDDAIGYCNVVPIAAFELGRQGLGSNSFLLQNVNWMVNSKAAKEPAAIKGVFFNNNWGLCRQASSAGFAAALAYIVTGQDTYLNFIKTQIHFVAGISPFSKSYIIGYGNGPNNPHHRNSIAYGKKCIGGVVSGPMLEGGNITFNDSRDEYKYTEVALDYNAGICGALAFLKEITSPPEGVVTIVTKLSISPTDIDFTTSKATIKATFNKASNCTTIISGVMTGAQKTFIGNTSSLNITWDGTADEGNFIAGEQISVNIKVGNLSFTQYAKCNVSAIVVKGPNLTFSANDKKLDDFNDGDLNNVKGGKWYAITDGSGQSFTSPEVLTDQTAIVATGESNTKAIRSKMYARTGAAHPFAGIAASFDANKNAVDIGPVKSIIFDVKALAANANFTVELEQADITDTGYHGVNVRLIKTDWARIRLPISSFSQPTGAAAKPLNLKTIKSIRFVVKEVATSADLTIDNVHLEDMSTATSNYLTSKNAVEMQTGFTKNILTYSVNNPKIDKIAIYNLAGKQVFSSSLAALLKSNRVEIDCARFNSGVYYLVNSTSDGKKVSSIKFIKP
jgi:hypothetical protein